MILVKFFGANRSFILRDLSELLTVTHLSWGTWAICSHLLFSVFWYERPEQFAHSRSFVLTDLSQSLMVAHLIWAIWANERMSDEPMREFPALLDIHYTTSRVGLVCQKTHYLASILWSFPEYKFKNSNFGCLDSQYPLMKNARNR